MFLSLLQIDTGNEPGRLWLRNMYHVHQRLCMGFPSKERKEEDGDFLEPFKTEDFTKGHVNVERGRNSGFLFRVDPRPGNTTVVLVQSALEPDWEYAFHNADYLLAAMPQKKRHDPDFTKNEKLRFRLLANPTRKVVNEEDGKKTKNGRRIPMPPEQFEQWLNRKAGDSGFELKHKELRCTPGYAYFKKPGQKNHNRLRSVRFDGVLEVTDVENFCAALVRGIGPAKGMGFGLLSVARM